MSHLSSFVFFYFFIIIIFKIKSGTDGIFPSVDNELDAIGDSHGSCIFHIESDDVSRIDNSRLYRISGREISCLGFYELFRFRHLYIKDIIEPDRHFRKIIIT